MNRYFLFLFHLADTLIVLERQMAEILRNGVVARPRKVWVMGGGAMALLALTGFASGESLSARVRACAAETDSLQRLACYDKSVAPFAEAASAVDPKSDATAGQMQHDSKANAAPDSAAQDRSAQKGSRHITAHVVSINSEHGQMMVYLDNGQVWEQVQEPTADLNLRAGDTVRIDMRSFFGSYWLGGRTKGVMKVRLKE
jgi:type II secretory pathway component PulM